MSNNASNRESLFIHLLTQFSMKFYYLCTWIRAPSRKSEVCIYCNRMAQLSTPFRPKVCNSLIINAIFTLHRQVELRTNNKR